MKDFLNWLTTGQTGNSQFVNKLENAVLKAKKHEEWKVEYMTLLMRDNEMMEKGRNDMLFSLVQDGTLSLEIAATKAEMPVEKFCKSHERSRIFYQGASMREDYHIYYENEEELSVWQPEIKM